MNSDHWKQFEGGPSIDCVQMKHDIQARIYEETKDMTWDERLEHVRQRADAWMARQSSLAGPALVLREEPAAYGKKGG